MHTSTLSFSDAELLERHLSGDPDAFRLIVERHQGALCAVAYSICGSRSRSEEIAQDAFVAGWKQAGGLREPARLRSWLCGIARNLAHNALRRDSRSAALALETAGIEPAAGEASPSEQAAAADREALLWATIEGLPETYREPLVLYYRERQDLASVAKALDLSDEAARQRLSRARVLLAGRLSAIIEETLAAGAPSPVFSAAVMLAIPLAAPAVGTAPAAGAAAKASLAFKLLTALAALPFILTGLTDFLRFRAAYEAADPAERPGVVRDHIFPLLISGLVVAAIVLPFWCPPLHTAAARGLTSVCVVVSVILLARARKKRPKEFETPAVFEYRSPLQFLGLPLVHIRAGGPKRERRARGWIALSDGASFGALLASGPIAVGPLAMGGVPIGLLAMGGWAIGGFAAGLVATGLWAAGLFAIGWQACTGLLAVGHTVATGAIAIGPHANDSLARATIAASPLTYLGRPGFHVGTWGCLLAWLPPLLLILVYGRGSGRADGARSRS